MKLEFMAWDSSEHDRDLRLEPTEYEYNVLTEAALSTGVIMSKLPYDDMSSALLWSFGTHGRYTMAQDASDDRKFCQLILAGMDDAYAVLLLAILSKASTTTYNNFARGPDGSDCSEITTT